MVLVVMFRSSSRHRRNGIVLRRPMREYTNQRIWENVRDKRRFIFSEGFYRYDSSHLTKKTFDALVLGVDGCCCCYGQWGFREAEEIERSI